VAPRRGRAEESATQDTGTGECRYADYRGWLLPLHVGSRLEVARRGEWRVRVDLKCHLAAGRRVERLHLLEARRPKARYDAEAS